MTVSVLTEVEQMHIVEELAIKATEHDQRAADEDSRVAAPWLWHRVANLHLGPLLLL